MRKTSSLRTCFFSLWNFECKFYPLWQNKINKVVKTSFCGSAKYFWKQWSFYWSIQIFFSRSCTLSEMFQAFLWEKAGKFIKTELCVSRRYFFSIENCNSHNWFISCTYSEKQFAKSFWQTYEGCTCFFYSNTLRKTSFLKSSFFFPGFWV